VKETVKTALGDAPAHGDSNILMCRYFDQNRIGRLSVTPTTKKKFWKIYSEFFSEIRPAVITVIKKLSTTRTEHQQHGAANTTSQGIVNNGIVLLLH